MQVPAPNHPAHVAIIMDGNGRWAKRKFLPRLAGHKAGVAVARKIAEAAQARGIKCLTLYAFSSENWRRSAEEVGDLMGLLRYFIVKDIDEIIARGVKLALLGDWRALEPDLVALLEAALERSAGNEKMTLAIALNYGAQQEIVAAAQRMVEEGGVVDVARFEKALTTAALPPLDLLVRTSGEMRLSNFMLWQAAYAELVFTPTLWPDYSAEDLDAALADYAKRERRYGGR